MPLHTQYECDTCHRTSVEEDYEDQDALRPWEVTDDRVVCAQCQMATAIRLRDEPAFIYRETEHFQFGAVEYGGQYHTYNEDHEEVAEFYSHNEVSFLGMTLSPRQAVDLIRDHDLVTDRENVEQVGFFSVRTTVVLGADTFSQDPDVPMHIVTEAINEWLRPALGLAS